MVSYAGMGNSLTIRKKAGVIQSIYMDQSLWGQYGDTPPMNHTPLYNKFIEGLTGTGSFHDMDGLRHEFIDNNQEPEITVKCPLCRTENNMKDIITIKGLSETCKVCLVNEIEKCFPACNHACLCGPCLESL